MYTWETDRLWYVDTASLALSVTHKLYDRYKNRQIVGANEKCIGIDLNR